MGYAKNEKEVLRHMAKQFQAGGQKIGPASESNWSDLKAEALGAMHQALTPNGIRILLDLGIGDMTPLERWDRWEDTSYMGVDGCGEIVARAALKYQGRYDRNFVLSPFSEIVTEGQGIPRPDMFDAVLLFDVLYHIQDDVLHRKLLDYAFRSRGGVALTYATEVVDYGGREIGQGGFAWFPRPEVSEYISGLTATGIWTVVYQSDDFRAGPQKQKLVALVRNRPPLQFTVGDDL